MRRWRSPAFPALHPEMNAATAVIQISPEAGTMCYMACTICCIEILCYALLQTLMELGAG